MGPILVTKWSYIGPLSHSYESHGLKMGPMWALHDIPLIKVGAPYHFYKQDPCGYHIVDLYDSCVVTIHDMSNHPVPKISFITDI